MSKKWFSSMLMVTVAGLLVLAACAPTDSFANQQGNPDGGVVSSDGSVELNPMQLNPASTGVGKSDAGAGSGDSASDPGRAVPKLALLYTESTYKFSVSYPADFVSRTRSAEQLAKLDFKPIASFMFMDPAAAKSQAPDEPGDLEIRIYNPVDKTALVEWLRSVGLTTSSELPPMYKTDNVSGLKVCRSTMIAPSCTYFFFGNNKVYQLISMTLTGDAMLNTFMLLP